MSVDNATGFWNSILDDASTAIHLDALKRAQIVLLQYITFAYCGQEVECRKALSNMFTGIVDTFQKNPKEYVRMELVVDWICLEALKTMCSWVRPYHLLGRRVVDTKTTLGDVHTLIMLRAQRHLAIFDRPTSVKRFYLWDTVHENPEVYTQTDHETNRQRDHKRAVPYARERFMRLGWTPLDRYPSYVQTCIRKKLEVDSVIHWPTIKDIARNVARIIPRTVFAWRE